MALEEELMDVVVAPEPELDPTIDVPEVDEDTADLPIVYDIRAPNMVPELLGTEKGKEAVRELANNVWKEVNDAWDAQDEYRERARKDWDIFSGVLPPRTGPFKNAANAHIPSFMEDASRLYMRMYTEAIGHGDEVFSVAPVGPDDQETAELLSRHGNWQLSTQLTDFLPQCERAALYFIMPGDVTGHSYYDTSRRKNRHEVLTPDDFIVPYVHTTTEPDYSDCPWVAKWLRLHKHQLQKMREQWHDVDSVIAARKPSWDDEPDAPLAEGQMEASGNHPGEDQRAPYKLVHFEGWIKLPNEPDERFCKVIMDWTTKKVLQIQLMEEPDWQDQARHDRQATELAQYRADKQRYVEESVRFQIQPPMPKVDPMTGAPMPPPEPPMELPMWMEHPDDAEDPEFEPKPVRMVPIHMFVHGKGIEPFAGPLGLGVGRVLADLNVASNTLLSHFIDSASLANCWTLLQAGGSKGQPPIEIVPGKINPLPGVAAKDLSSVLMPLNPSPANPQLRELIEFFRQLSEGAAQAPSVLSGESGKSGETYRGIQTRIEQATKQISFITGKYARFVSGLIKNNARLNAQFMPEEEIVNVNNHKLGTLTELRVGRQLYERDYRVVMTADLRFASQAARVAEADQIFQMAVATPQLANNIPFLQATAREVLSARGKDNLIKYLGQELAPLTQGVGLQMPTAVDPPPGMPPQAPPGAPPPPGAPEAPPASAAPEGPPVQ
jgi:hypothetical protein